jgi:hypothetical protein
MTLIDIVEHKNPIESEMKPIEENQEIIIPDIVDPNIPNRNGFISLYTGSGGSGKTSLLLNMITNKNMYRGVFNNIFYICPEASFSSVKNHPFKGHDKVFHELTVDLLEEIYQALQGIVTERERLKDEQKDKKKKKKGNYSAFIDEEDIRETPGKTRKPKPIQYHLVFIDDFANELKNPDIQKQLSKMLIKSRHICCAFIFTLQSYYYFPKIMRKQITNNIIFKPKNVEEFISLARELFNMGGTDALEVFNYCFDKPYNHLDVNTVDNTYYKNFNALELIYEKMSAENHQREIQRQQRIREKDQRVQLEALQNASDSKALKIKM